MAWIQRIKSGQGWRWWVRDKRQGHEIVIIACDTQAEAEMHKETYEIRMDLEKEGYEDRHQALLDQLWGPPPVNKTGDF